MKMNNKTPKSQIKVLLIDDDTFTLALLEKALKEYKVFTAASGEEGLKTHQKQQADIIFLDIDMPGMTGHETLMEIKKSDPDAYVVMLTGYGQMQNCQMSQEEGAKGLLVKPAKKEDLLKYIEKAS